MTDITSTNNRMIVETVKLHQKKYRNSSGLFLLEGEKSVEEAFKAGIDIQTVFVNQKELRCKVGNCKSYQSEIDYILAEYQRILETL